MKKIRSLFAACGGSAQNAGDSTEGNTAQTENIGSALELLTTVWDSYAEDERFPAADGDYEETNSVMDAPGSFGLADTANADSMLGLPESAASQIDDAASLMHMMNANTFTCGSFHVTSADDVPAVADALQQNIMQRQWMCGFPEKLLATYASAEIWFCCFLA